MSIHYAIPHTSRYISTGTIFDTTFGAYTPARYDFTLDPACRNLVALPLQEGCLYLVERMTVGGNLTEGQYLESIDDFPRLIMKRRQNDEPIYQQPLPVPGYSDNTEVAAWVNSDKRDDALILTFEGRLAQLPSMVGILTARIEVSFHIYDIHDVAFIRSYRDRLGNGIGREIGGR